MSKNNQNFGKLFLVGFPVTDRCNLTCPHCLSRINGNLKKSPDMEPYIAEYLASEIAGRVEYINLSAGYGETYLNKNISRILDVFHHHGIKTITYTNGSDASREGILNSYTDILLISIDEYHSSCDTIFFDRQCSLINDISITGERSIAEKIVLTCALDSKYFCPEYIGAIAILCDKYPFLSAEFHWRMEYCHDNAKKGCTGQVIESYIGYFNMIDKGKITPPPFLHYPDNQCSDIFRSLYFDSQGNLRKCCIFPDTITGLNIFQQSLEEILNAPQLEAIRKYWKENNGYSFCRKCPIGFGIV